MEILDIEYRYECDGYGQEWLEDRDDDEDEESSDKDEESSDEE